MLVMYFLTFLCEAFQFMGLFYNFSAFKNLPVLFLRLVFNALGHQKKKSCCNIYFSVISEGGRECRKYYVNLALFVLLTFGISL